MERMWSRGTEDPRGCGSGRGRNISGEARGDHQWTAGRDRQGGDWGNERPQVNCKNRPGRCWDRGPGDCGKKARWVARAQLERRMDSTGTLEAEMAP